MTEVPSGRFSGCTGVRVMYGRGNTTCDEAYGVGGVEEVWRGGRQHRRAATHFLCGGIGAACKHLRPRRRSFLLCWSCVPLFLFSFVLFFNPRMFSRGQVIRSNTVDYTWRGLSDTKPRPVAPNRAGGRSASPKVS